MAFWSNATAEPLRQFRWVVNFGGNEVTSLDKVSFALKKIGRPKLKVGEITHKYINHSFYYPGRVEWEAINMTFAAVPVNANDGEPGTAGSLLSILSDAGYVIPNKAALVGANVSTLAKEKFKNSVGDMHIRNISPDGNTVLEGFVLVNPFFTSIEFGEMDYGSDEVLDITCTVRYDYAKFTTDGANVVAGTPTLGT